MSFLLHPAALTAATLTCFLIAMASVDINDANAQETVTAPELATTRGWPYADPSWRFRGDDRRPARIVVPLPADVEQDRRNAALLALATR